MSKRDKNSQPLKEVIQKLLDAYRLTDKLTEVNIRGAWESIMGKAIAQHTTDMYIHSKVLYIQLDSSVLREELHYAREKIVENINEYAGRVIVEKVVLR